MNLRRERILVTGAGGFVGASLVRKLISMGIRPHVLLRATTDVWRLSDLNREMVVCHVDLLDHSRLQSFLADIRPTIIYHMATHGGLPTQTDAQHIWNVNTIGTLNLLEALKDVPYKLFVNAGSSAEYGFTDTPMRETDAIEPNSFYAVAKAAQSLLCQYVSRAQKKTIVTLRLFSVYGPYEEPTRLIPTLVRCCLKGDDLTMADPETARDFVFIDDVLKAFLSGDQLIHCGGEIINIGSGHQTKLKDVVAEAMHVAGVTCRVHWKAMPDRIWDAPTWVADVSKAADLLAWRPTTSLSEGLTQTMIWLKYHAS